MALVIFAVLSLTVFFKVENIVVYGSSVYTAEEIAEVSGIKGGENMIRKSMGRAEKRITSGAYLYRGGGDKAEAAVVGGDMGNALHRDCLYAE